MASSCGEVCVIYRCSYEEYDDVYNIFIVDLNDTGSASAGYIEKLPTLRLEGFDQLCFCLVDSSLYMFDATSSVGYEGLNRGEVWAYTLDLRPYVSKYDSIVDSYVVEQCKAPDMLSPKFLAEAILTPDNKRILVYSSMIEFRTEENTDIIDFELFDPNTKLWTGLPPLQLRLPNYTYGKLGYFYFRDRHGSWNKTYTSDDYGNWYENTYHFGNLLRIIGGNFINKNTFLVGIDLGVFFTLNIESPGEGWQHFKGCIKPDYYQFLIVQDRLLTPFTVTNSSGTITHRFGRSLRGRSLHSLTHYTTLVDYVENRDCTVCSVTTALDDLNLYPCLIINSFKIDLEDENKPPNHINSLKFVVSRECRFLVMNSVFPM